jgi:acetyl-CoA synthetase
MPDYPACRDAFSWASEREELGSLPNMAAACVDRHARGAGADRVALRYLRRDGSTDSITYAALAAATNRFANVLASLGVKRGETVFSVLGRVPELYVAALGTLKAGAVFCPLFSAFGPEPIEARLSLGAAKVVVTTASFYAKKIAPIRKNVPSLAHVLIIDDALSGTTDFRPLMDDASATFEPVPTRADDWALLHFTSGTTGKPKGAIHAHGALVQHYVTAKYALDLRPGDTFWCTADPGWVTGMSYGILAPLAIGVTSIVDEADFDAERWYRILEEDRVNVWYTAPTAVRMLMKAGPELIGNRRFPALRFIASVGEPLNPEAVIWSNEILRRPIHDNWWQTETGGIMIANYAAMSIKPGSMGKPMPGIDAAVVERLPGGGVKVIDEPNVEGELALKRPWPSMFRGYLGEQRRYEACFSGDWYLSGDLCRRDEDGYYWFVGRADDIIKSAGHLIGPFEVESALMEHPAVAEAGVIGKPDPVVMEAVKAFVSLKHGYEPSDALRRELLGFSRQRLGAAIAPKEIAFIAELPRTRSGKIMRRLLKARELGLPEGDLSTLEGGR